MALCPGTGGSPATAFGGRWPSPPSSPGGSEQVHHQAGTGSVTQSTEEPAAGFETQWACRLEPTGGQPRQVLEEVTWGKGGGGCTPRAQEAASTQSPGRGSASHVAAQFPGLRAGGLPAGSVFVLGYLSLQSPAKDKLRICANTPATPRAADGYQKPRVYFSLFCTLWTCGPALNFMLDV